MSFVKGYLIDIVELNNLIQYFDEAISENLSEGGLVDRRFSGALALINMLFEKSETSRKYGYLIEKISRVETGMPGIEKASTLVAQTFQ